MLVLAVEYPPLLSSPEVATHGQCPAKTGKHPTRRNFADEARLATVPSHRPARPVCFRPPAVVGPTFPPPEHLPARVRLCGRRPCQNSPSSLTRPPVTAVPRAPRIGFCAH